MADPSASIVRDPVRMTDACPWSDRSYLDQGLPYPPEMAAAPTSTPMSTRRKSRRSWFEKTPATNFEIKVESPKEKQKPVRKQRRESEEPEILTLTHFTAPPRIGYGKMKPGDVKQRTLLLRNPHDYEQTVHVEKVPEKKFFNVDTKCIVVPARETCALTIIWTPKDEGNFREMILMQVDKSYRLQAYVFGSVVAPKQKKKVRKGGLLSTKVNRPFSVIHTTSLANIDRSYSPEKATLNFKHSDRDIGGQCKENQSNYTTNRRQSQRLSATKVIHAGEINNKVDQTEPETKLEKKSFAGKQTLKKSYSRSEKDEQIPKKKLRRSNTYSNVSGTGLPLPIICDEGIKDHVSIESQKNLKNNPMVSSEIIGTQSFSCDTKQTVNSLPSFLEHDEKVSDAKSRNSSEKETSHSFVEIDSLESNKETNVSAKKSDLEHSFIEIESQICEEIPNFKETYSCKTAKNKSSNEKLATDAINECDFVEEEIIMKDTVTEDDRQKDYCQKIKNPVLNNLKENSFKDSLDETPDMIEPPSFLSPDSFMEDAINYKLRRSGRKIKQNTEMKSPTNTAHLRNHLNSSRHIVSPQSFVREMDSMNTIKTEEKHRENSPSPDTVLNDSIPHAVVIEQLESIKAKLNDQSSNKQTNVKDMSGIYNKTNGNSKTRFLQSGPDNFDERETFIKKRSSPRFSVASSEADFRRGTFVVGAKKAKLLDHQQPSEASPRRTTFTVIKKATISASKMKARARSDEIPRDFHRRSRSQNKVCQKVNASKDQKNIVKQTPVKVESEILTKGSFNENVPTSDNTKQDNANNNKDELDFMCAGEISKENINEAPTRRCTLTVTKSKPCDALVKQASRTESIAANLFPGKSHLNSFDRSQSYLDSFNEDEDSLQTAQKSSKNSTFEVSANKSILLNKSSEKADSFPLTPNELPSSPNPDHSRRSTHVVEKPKVLDLSRIDRKQLFPCIVDYEADTNSISANSTEHCNEQIAINDDGSDQSQNVNCKTDSPSSNTRSAAARTSINDSTDQSQSVNCKTDSPSSNTRSAAARKSLIDSIEQNEQDTTDSGKTENKNRSHRSDTKETRNRSGSEVRKGESTEQNPQDTTDSGKTENKNRFHQSDTKETRNRSGSEVRKDKSTEQNEQDTTDRGKTENKNRFHRSDTKETRNRSGLEVSNDEAEKEKDSQTKQTGGIYFVPFDNKVQKEVERTVRNGPHAFLKKRSNVVVQSEDRLQSKRIKSDSEDLRKKAVKAEKQRPTVTRSTRSKSSGKASERLERQVLRPRAAVKGVAQSKLILMKKTKTALPKHPLPFAAKNMYYDERWMEKQERGFVNWLNFILTPAEEYQSNEVKVKVDAGKLSIDVAKGNTKLAPTNEVLSFRAYAAHRKLNRLRKSACRLFQSEEVIRVVQKLEAEVESRRLRVRKDKMVHADLGVKQKILDMLLSYNTLWLRVGLETTYGEVVPLLSNSDVFGLSRFMLTRLLNSPDIAEEYAHPTVPHLYREGYAETVAQHTLKKFMILVYFLDKAKQSRLIEHNPCLFCKDSDIKASKDFLLQFSRDYLSGEGDITRHLGYIGYKVTYTQTALDEFDFAVSKLSTDLRDGLRLTRVMEFLSNKADLSRNLRVPAISRLQKIHNVEVVFKTLEEQAIQCGKVTTRDIVDGHREKTLQLLWTIILHYQVELLLNEEQLKEEIDILEKSLKVKSQLQDLLSFQQKPSRESAEPDLHTQNPRLNLLLKWCRTVCAFYSIKIENFTVSFSDGRALCYIVHHYHPGLLSAEDIHSETTLTHLEDMQKNTQQNLAASFNDSCNSSAAFGDVEDPEIFEGLLNNEKENFKVLFEKVKELGGIPLMLKWSDMSNTIPDEKVVVTYLLYLCARLLDIRHESRAARVIQLAWRKNRLRKMEIEMKIKNHAASVIQAAARRYLASKLLARQAISALCIQRVWRGHQGRQLARKLRLEKVYQAQIQAVRVLQLAVRGYLQRRRFLEMKHSIILVQAYCRGKLLRQKMSSAAITIQKWVRGHQVRKHQQQMRNSVTMIQAQVRGYLVRSRLQKYHQSASMIQAAYRAHRLGKAELQKFSEMKNACISIQRKFRFYLKKKEERRIDCAVKIQSCFRGYVAKRGYLKKKASAVCIQAAYRSHWHRKKFLESKKAVTSLQRYFRAYIAGRKQREEYLSLRHTAVYIQSRRRMITQKRKFELAKQSVTRLQASVRMILTKKRYMKLKTAVTNCQRRYRAKVLGIAGRHEFLVKKGAAITIQSVFRGHMVRRHVCSLRSAVTIIQSSIKGYLQRRRYNTVKTSVIALQRRWRAELVSRQERKNFLELRNTAIMVQSRYRGLRVRKQYEMTRQKIVLLQAYVKGYQQRQKYQRLKQASLVIQRKWRAELVARQHVMVYKSTKAAVIQLQSFFRMSLQRRRYSSLQKAAVTIQACLRMYIQQQHLRKLKNAALILQERFRARLEGQKCRQEYLVKLGAIITIQAAYRSYCVQREMSRKRQAAIIVQTNVRRFLQRNNFLRLKTATLVIQKLLRAKLEGEKCRRQYLITCGAVITLQSAYRGHCVRKDLKQKANAALVIQSHFRRFLQKARYLRLKKSVILCQRQYRAKMAGKLERCEFLVKKNAAIKIQSKFRQHTCRQQYLYDRSQIIKVQACIRRKQMQKKFRKTKEAAILIQRRWREVLAGREQRCQYQKLKQSAVLIQATWRMKQEKRNYEHMKSCVVKIQSVIRMAVKLSWFRRLKSATETIQKYYKAKIIADKCRQEFLISKGAAITIQAFYRGYLTRKHMQCNHEAAALIQSCFRGYQQRSMYKQLKAVTISCQRQFRAKLIGHKVEGEYRTVKKGVIRLQAAVRGRAERQKYLKLKNLAIIIQSMFRGNKTRSELERQRQAAVVIQTRYRANIVARQQRQNYLAMQQAAVVIQSYWRMTMIRYRYVRMVKSVVKLQSLGKMICARNRYLYMQECAAKIQRWFRGALETKRLQFKFLVAKGAAITIQAAIRGFLARRMCQMISAARKIQAVYRGYREHKKYQSIRQAVIVVQSTLRGYLARKHVQQLKCRQMAAVSLQQRWRALKESRTRRCEYLKLKSAVIVCQSIYRAKLATVKAQRDFLKQRSAACTIQYVFRRYIRRKLEKIENHAAVRIQSAFRCYKQTRQFLELKRSAVVCQKRFSAILTARRQRNHFLSLRKAVITMQSNRRAIVCRRNFLKMKHAAIRIQSCYKGYLQRKAITQAHQAATVLQRRWRAELLCRQQLHEYQSLRDAAVIIQSVFRAHQAKALFARMKAAVKIQSYWKMVLAQKQYRQLLAASVRIQAHFKTWRVRKEFLAVREQRRQEREAQLHRIAMVTKVNMAAIRIQRTYRNYVMTKLAREKLHSVILLQRWMRAKLLRIHYLQTRKRICHLQAAIRNWLSRRHSAARVIQRIARHWLANKHVRNQEKAAVKIQAFWKGYSLRRKSKSKRLTLVRQRVEKANAAATEESKLGNRTSSALDYLLKYKHLSPVLDALKHLDVATRLSPVCCEKMVEVNALGVLYRLVNSCNRSLPHMELIKYTVNILLNLAKYEKTRHAVYSEEDGIHTILELMQIYREKKGLIFIKACTLLGILALDSSCKMSVLADKKAIERLRSIQTLTARKHKLEENQRITRARMNATMNSTFMVRSPVKRHKIKPDWSLHRDKLVDFDSPLKAINFVLGNLGIQVK